MSVREKIQSEFDRVKKNFDDKYGDEVLSGRGELINMYLDPKGAMAQMHEIANLKGLKFALEQFED